MARCNSCPAEIEWLAHEGTGKDAPIDAQPSDGGNVLPNLDDRTYRIVPAAERPGFAGRLHTNHFVTCPAAKGWRGGRRY